MDSFLTYSMAGFRGIVAIVAAILCFPFFLPFYLLGRLLHACGLDLRDDDDGVDF